MATDRQNILWVDDEIDLLRPHILYLEGKGYRVTAVTNGPDALDLVKRERFDVVLLDEMMPGMGGLEVLEGIKECCPRLPVIMITKSEEENLMNQALGHKISDYLIKPVNPGQIHLACKKLFESADLERGQAVRDYVREVGEEAGAPAGVTWDAWTEQYLKSVRWDLELDRIEEAGLHEAHRLRLGELNRSFSRFIEDNYAAWVAQAPGERPLMSPDIVPRRVVPALKAGERIALIVIDCLRLDQWLMLEAVLPQGLEVELEPACAILPTTTAYARNAIFSGLFPRDLAAAHPEFWTEARTDDLGKNRFERDLLVGMLARAGSRSDKVLYRKVVDRQDADELTRQMGSFAELDLVALVFTFVDTFAHGRSRDAILAEFAQDPGALRAHLRTWFERSVLLDVLREMARQGRRTIVTTDHGNIQVRRPALVRGDRDTEGGVRAKVGKALGCNAEEALLVSTPAAFGLPEGGLMKSYIFAREDRFFVFAKKRHEYERLFRGTFQHGGISMEEMILPLATLRPA